MPSFEQCTARYGNTGCQVFKRGYKTRNFCLRINIRTQRKLLNFENWVNGEVSKSAKISLSKSIFYVKNYPNLSHFFFIEKYQFMGILFVVDFF